MQFSPEEKTRFWSKVDKSGGESACWIWTARKNKNGYGGCDFRRQRIRLAHRAAWAIANGSLPSELCVLHRCDNPPCVNPKHLFLGDPEDNARDRETKGRGNHAIGSRNGHSKLSTEEVLQIRYLRDTEDLSFKELSRQFGVTREMISLIIRGKNWGHLAPSV